MSKSSGKVLLDKLKTIVEDVNINCEALDWLFECEGVSGVCEWLCEDIGQENILSALELHRFNEVKKNGRELNKEQLQQEKVKFENKYPGLFDVDEREVDDLEEELKLLEEELGSINQLTTSYMILDNKHNWFIDTENSNITNLPEYHSCLSVSEELDSVKKNTHSELENLFGLYKNIGIRSSLLLIEKPLSVYQDSLNAYNDKLNLWVQKRFKTKPIKPDIVTSTPGPSKKTDSFQDSFSWFKTQPDITISTPASCEYSVENDPFFKELIKYKSLLNSNTVENIETRCQCIRLQTMLDFYTTSSYSCSEDTQTLAVKVEIARQEFNLKMDALKTLVENNTKQLINKVLIDEARKRLQTERDMLKYLEELINDVANTLAYKELLLLLLLEEKRRAENTPPLIAHIQKQIFSSYQNTLNRNNAMGTLTCQYKQYLATTPVEHQNSNLSAIIKFLTHGRSKEPTLEEAANCFTRQHKQVKQLDIEIFIDKPKEFLKSVESLESKIKETGRLLTSSPSSGPVLIIPKMVRNILQTHSIRDELKAAFHASTKHFYKAKINLSNNHFLRTMRILWMLFLMEPKRVLTETEKLQAHFNETLQKTLSSDLKL